MQPTEPTSPADNGINNVEFLGTLHLDGETASPPAKPTLSPAGSVTVPDTWLADVHRLILRYQADLVAEIETTRRERHDDELQCLVDDAAMVLASPHMARRFGGSNGRHREEGDQSA